INKSRSHVCYLNPVNIFPRPVDGDFWVLPLLTVGLEVLEVEGLCLTKILMVYSHQKNWGMILLVYCRQMYWGTILMVYSHQKYWGTILMAASFVPTMGIHVYKCFTISRDNDHFQYEKELEMPSIRDQKVKEMTSRSTFFLMMTVLVISYIIVCEAKQARMCRYLKKRDACKDVLPKHLRKYNPRKCPCIKNMGKCASINGTCEIEEKRNGGKKCVCKTTGTIQIYGGPTDRPAVFRNILYELQPLVDFESMILIIFQTMKLTFSLHAELFVEVPKAKSDLNLLDLCP
ncbi:hypothetical protein MAR_028931, partial [Mya arenaria]